MGRRAEKEVLCVKDYQSIELNADLQLHDLAYAISIGGIFFCFL